MGAREKRVRVTYINGIRTGEEECRAHAELIGEMFAAPCHFYHNETAGAWADLSQVGSCIDTNRCAPVCPSFSIAEHRQAMHALHFLPSAATHLRRAWSADVYTMRPKLHRSRRTSLINSKLPSYCPMARGNQPRLHGKRSSRRIQRKCCSWHNTCHITLTLWAPTAC